MIGLIFLGACQASESEPEENSDRVTGMELGPKDRPESEDNQRLTIVCLLDADASGCPRGSGESRFPTSTAPQHDALNR